MKRTVFFVVALFALMAVGLYAQTEDDFTTRAIDGGKSLEVTKYNGSAALVKIPNYIQNLPVTSIGNDAFRENKNITTVLIDFGVTRIGARAFQSCFKLTRIDIPKSITTIENSAFGACSSLTSVTIPNSVTSIEDNTFTGCTKLASVTIGNGVTSIYNNAFMRCTSLTSVTFSGTIPSSDFNDSAFKGLGDIRDKYLAAGGGAGTYTRPSGGTTWTKQ